MRKIASILSVLLFIPLVISSQTYYSGDHELFLMPTAETMPKGSFYFADYELLIINFTYAPTSSTHVGVYTIFPVVAEFLETVTVSVKQRYLNTQSFRSAAWFTYSPKSNFFSVGNSISIGKQKTNFHLGIGALTVFDDTSDWELVYMAGVKFRASSRLSLLAEYTNFSTLIDEDYYGFVSIGVRIHWSKAALDIGGFRPLEDSGDLILIPIVKFTIFF